MKRLAPTMVALLGWTSMYAMADCSSNTKVSGNALDTLVSGNTVCAVRGGERWQEQHRGGGQLWDYKMGPSDPVDPTAQVGTWSIAANQVTYSYTGGSSYSYDIHGPNGGSYDFCQGNAPVVTGATFKIGLQGC